MSKKLLFSMAVLVAAMMCALGASAKEAYACYTSENKTFTFYYDNERSTCPGNTFLLQDEPDHTPMWSLLLLPAAKAEFDRSFANYRPTTTHGWFYYMQNLQSVTGLRYLNTCDVTDMGEMFANCTQLTSLDLNGLNTSKVTNMSRMFDGCTALTSLNLNGLNTSNVTNMGSMFDGCRSLTSIDLSDFSTASATRMYGMFEDCHGLTRLDLSTFNTANVSDMTRMFLYCDHLQTIYVGDEWSHVSLLYSSRMFTGCNSLVGGQGTTCDEGHVNADYAHIDGGPSNPGYFTKRPAFTRGDVNDDLDITISDATALVDSLEVREASALLSMGCGCFCIRDSV